MKCKDCVCSEVCYYKAFNDVRAVKRRDDVEKVCKSFVYRDSVKVDAVEVVHGRWEDTPCVGYKKCSNCKEDSAIFSGGRNYCPNCGAKMDGGTDGSN